jgi:hypothetical protein
VDVNYSRSTLLHGDCYVAKWLLSYIGVFELVAQLLTLFAVRICWHEAEMICVLYFFL